MEAETVRRNNQMELTEQLVLLDLNRDCPLQMHLNLKLMYRQKKI